MLDKPHCPKFSSGPTRKRPGWSLEALPTNLLGRGHRTPDGKGRIQYLLKLMREVLQIPDDYHVGIIPGSATGANECGFWNLLGARGVDVFYWELFGSLWAYDIHSQLSLPDYRLFSAAFGEIPDLSQYDGQRDVIFTWNGTTSGVCVSNLDWIPANRQGLSFCDATSAAFCVPLEWSKLDVTAFSWQKGLGGEAAHGMLVLSPSAMERLQAYTPTWPIPRLFRLKRDTGIVKGIFHGETINTPSLLCIEDCIDALQWAQSVGGLLGLIERVEKNFQIIDGWVNETPWVQYLAKDPDYRSHTSVCLELIGDDVEKKTAKLVAYLGENDVAYDIKNHRDAPCSLRVWCGPTVENNDLKRFVSWVSCAL